MDTNPRNERLCYLYPLPMSFVSSVGSVYWLSIRDSPSMFPNVYFLGSIVFVISLYVVTSFIDVIYGYNIVKVQHSCRLHTIKKVIDILRLNDKKDKI